MKWSKLLYDIAWAFTVAMILRLVFGFFLGTSFPFVAVMSESMTHDAYVVQNYYVWMESRGFTRDQLQDFPFAGGFSKGDALIIGSPDSIAVGDVVVYVNPDLGYAIIHRVVNVTSAGYVTKGDRNPAPDPWLVQDRWVKGKAAFLLPLVGWIRVLPADIIRAVGGLF
jgi:signal peptidase I